eukprot:7116867-Heterocapsa_arctica.AAC.2
MLIAQLSSAGSLAQFYSRQPVRLDFLHPALLACDPKGGSVLVLGLPGLECPVPWKDDVDRACVSCGSGR